MVEEKKSGKFSFKILVFETFFLKFEGFWLLPIEFGTTEMSVGRSALENWTLQVEVPEI